jgi:uncharacterized protein
VKLVVDAGPLYAVADRRDRNHARCRELLEAAPRPLLVPVLVVTEVAYLIRERLGPDAEVVFGESITSGEMAPIPPEPADWDRIVELARTYADLPLGMVDASIVALAERLDVQLIATLDRRHFGAVRPRHAEAFELVP